MLIPSPARQIAFHQLLVAARKTWLSDALSTALEHVDPDLLRRQLGELIPADVQRLLSASGIRDEYVFPTPALLEEAPTLLGYYRLLLGSSQKSFYSSDSGLGRFKKLETHGSLPASLRADIPALCADLAEALSDLMRQISPAVSQRDISELPLLTLGSQFQGANNNSIGRQATLEVFLAVAEIVESSIIERSDTRLTIKNASGRIVLITLAADPDLRIEEHFGDELRRKVAIEIRAAQTGATLTTAPARPRSRTRRRGARAFATSG